MSAKEKQADAKQTFVFLAPLANNRSAKQTKKRRMCAIVSRRCNECKRKTSGCEADKKAQYAHDCEQKI